MQFEGKEEKEAVKYTHTHTHIMVITTKEAAARIFAIIGTKELPHFLAPFFRKRSLTRCERRTAVVQGMPGVP